MNFWPLPVILVHPMLNTTYSFSSFTSKNARIFFLFFSFCLFFLSFYFPFFFLLLFLLLTALCILSTSWRTTWPSSAINLPFIFFFFFFFFWDVYRHHPVADLRTQKKHSVYIQSTCYYYSKMSSIVYPLLFLFLISFLIEPTTPAIQNYFQNLELDDVTSLWDKFPSIVAQIKQAGMLLKNSRMKVEELFFFQGHLYQKEKIMSAL